MNPDTNKAVGVVQEECEDEAPKKFEGKAAKAKLEKGNSDSDHAVASNSVDNHSYTKDQTAACGEKRALAQTAENEAGKGDEPEGPRIKRPKITATSKSRTTSAKNSTDTSERKSIFPFTSAPFSGPSVILVFGITARHEINIHESLLSLNDYFRHKIESAIPDPDSQIRLQFFQHPQSAGELLREYLYHSRLPWCGSDIAVLKGKEAATVSAKILALYILADPVNMPALQCQLLRLYKVFQPPEIDLDGHMDKLDKAVGNPADALRNVIQTKLDALASGSSANSPEPARKEAKNLVRRKLEQIALKKVKNIAQEQAKNPARKEWKSFTRDEVKKSPRKGMKNVTQHVVRHGAQEEVKNIPQEEAKNNTRQPKQGRLRLVSNRSNAQTGESTYGRRLRQGFTARRRYRVFNDGWTKTREKTQLPCRPSSKWKLTSPPKLIPPPGQSARFYESW